METIFYYFLRRSVDGIPMDRPYPSFDYLGEPSDFVELDGVGYIIEDYATEPVYVGE